MKTFQVRLVVNVTIPVSASNQEEAEKSAAKIARSLEWSTSSFAGRSADVGEVAVSGVTPVLE